MARHLLFPCLAIPLLLTTPSGAFAQGDPYLVQIAQVTQQQVQASRRVVGTIQPARTSTIGTGTNGRVEKYHVQVGSAVKAGNPLAQLRTTTLDIELAAADAQLRLFESQFKELENGSLPEEIAEARARTMAAKAAMENASRQLNRMAELSNANAATEADVEDARERSEATRFTYDALQAMLERIEQGPRAELLAQAAARVDLQKQQIALIEDRKRKHTIMVPFDGFIAEEFTEVGAWVSAGDPVATVIELRRVEVSAPASAETALDLKIGQEVRIEFPELPEKLMTGKVVRIVPRAEGTARVFPVIVAVDNEMRQGLPLLLSGMLARVHLPEGPARSGFVVPKDALVLSSRSRSVYVVDLKSESVGNARRVEVELGISINGNIEIVGDLKPGDLVVIEGNERLVDGQQVEIANPITGS